MRVPSISASSGAGSSNPRATATIRDPAAPDADTTSGDLVDLHHASARELADALGLETLLAIMQGILEAHSGQPLRLSDPQHAIGSLYDDATAPAWLAAARHAFAHPTAPVLRLSVIGTLTRVDDEPQPFVLDMQLPWAPPALAGMEHDGSFVLSHATGQSQGARVDYTLTPVSEFHAADRCNPPQPAPSAPAVSVPPGTPLFAQFSLGRDPDILCMAARLLPAGRDPALPLHAFARRDGGYVDIGDHAGSPHQVDISA